MAVIEEEIESGLNGQAVRNLTALLAWKPDSDEALYLLGTCEMARRRHQAAAAAWARVSPRSPFARQAMVGRVQAQLDLGRLADAEQMIRDALDDPRVAGVNLRLLLGTVYLPQGRLEETLRLIEAGWDAMNQKGEAASESGIKLVRAHIDLRLSPGEIEVGRANLEWAGRTSPEDDRIWLGKANQAIGDRSYDEALRLARRLRAAASRRCRGLAHPAELGREDQSRHGGAASTDASARGAVRLGLKSKSWQPGSRPGAGTSSRNGERSSV